MKKFGHVDVLLNNAGILFFDNAEDIDLDEWHKILSVDLDGVMLGVKYRIRHMKDRGGSIINMCSIAGLIGISNLYAYNAAKGGVRILTKSAALYCAEKKYPIRVNSVHPGYAHTPMVDAYPEMEEGLEKLHPMGRLGEAREIANMALYLASDESSFSTGSEFVVDGGLHGPVIWQDERKTRRDSLTRQTGGSAAEGSPSGGALLIAKEQAHEGQRSHGHLAHTAH